MPVERPYFLDLTAIRLPVGGVVSILHRASGALLSLAVPGLLYALMLSLRSPEDFLRLRQVFGGFSGALLVFVLIWALLHHLLAGLRHLGFDLGLGDDKAGARRSAWFVLFAAFLLGAAITLWQAR